MSEKILRLSQLSPSLIGDLLKEAVVCFGHFNSIHPGHIRYFRAASQFGSNLVVALEGDIHFPQIDLPQVFSELERAQSVSALDMVSHVVILDCGRLEDFVARHNAQAMVLGKEFEEKRFAKVTKAVTAFRANGGQVIFDAGETHYSSAALLYGSPTDLERGQWHQFAQAQKAQDVSMVDIFSAFNRGAAPRILVIGDTIVDRYVACDPLGMSSEAPVVVVKELEARDYVGGGGIVASHVAALGAECHYLSVAGDDENAEFIQAALIDAGVTSHQVVDKSRPTTFKIRYMVENQKLFRVSRLKEHSVNAEIEDELIEKIEEWAPEMGVILVSDFVYGVITPKILASLRRVSKKHDLSLLGDLQCSSQVGSVLKFQDFDLICPTEREARIALGNHDDGVEYVANLLAEKTAAKNLILKMGAEGFITYQRDDKNGTYLRQHFPALSANPVDVAGAGDAMISAIAVGVARGLSLMQASAFASCVSAIAVRTVGNLPINLDRVKQFYFQHSWES
jgi:rfaE bifunctional protein kinase chain/domain